MFSVDIQEKAWYREIITESICARIGTFETDILKKHEWWYNRQIMLACSLSFFRPAREKLHLSCHFYKTMNGYQIILIKSWAWSQEVDKSQITETVIRGDWPKPI